MPLPRPRPPLLVTGFTLGLLLLGPIGWLARHPRQHAAGLERLAASAALLQSFRTGGLSPPPSLWIRRLGPGLAQQLWARPTGLWWQFWGGHGDGAEFLVLPAEPFAGARPLPLPAPALRVDDLVVLAADPLNRQWLQDQLRLKFAPPQGLQRHCLGLLKSSEAVYWSGPTLGDLLGPLTPLFLPFQQGCFGLAGEGKALLWQGLAGPLGPGPLGIGTAGPASPAPVPAVAASPPPDALLLLQGPRLGPLLDGLLASRLVSEPLQKSYGLGPAQLGLLRQAPFQLWLRAQAKGPYQAGLALHLGLGDHPSDWQVLLAGLRKGLLAQGLEERDAATPRWQGQVQRERFNPSTWQRPGPGGPGPGPGAGATAESRVVGGWRWLNRSRGASRGANDQGPPQELLLFLGPEPKPGAIAPAAAGSLAQQASGRFSLWARPQGLARLGLWPSGLPPLLKRSRSLQIQVEARAGSAGSGPSPLAGRLELP